MKKHLAFKNKRKIFLISISLIIIINSLNVCKIKNELILATTTSVQDSGLLDIIIPIFESRYGYNVKVLAVGSGEALKMGERGDADILLVHDPISEQNFMKKGFGKVRKKIMHNDFILLGPREDPAKVKGLSIFEAFRRISQTESLFVSRADKSGTNKKELEIWKNAGIKPQKKWYLEVGQGMGICLRIASEREGYILSDRATYTALKKSLNLRIMVDGEKILFNPYHLIIVNPKKFSNINYEASQDFMKFITSKKVKKIIDNFGVDKYGEQLFYTDF